MPLIGRERVDKAIDKLVANQNKRVKEVWTQGLKAIITATPVHFKDGGRLRNNWFLSVGQPDNSTRGKGRNGGESTQSVDKMPSWVLGKKLFFSNNLPYANVVEYGGYPKSPAKGTYTGSSYQILSSNGYSKQAPSGMVRINLVKMRAKL